MREGNKVKSSCWTFLIYNRHGSTWAPHCGGGQDTRPERDIGTTNAALPTMVRMSHPQ